VFGMLVTHTQQSQKHDIIAELRLTLTLTILKDFILSVKIESKVTDPNVDHFISDNCQND